MSLYALIGVDREDSLAVRVKVREAHLARLRELLDDGRQVNAGPFPTGDVNEPTPAGFEGTPVPLRLGRDAPGR